MKNFDVLEFRFMNVEDFYNIETFKDKFAWSRVYEYPFVINEILDYKKEAKKDKVDVHNTSWGFEGIHVIFRKELDKISNATHSDIVENKLNLETLLYDITEDDQQYHNKYDIVINISTIEHLRTSEEQKKSIENLFNQVREGGKLIITFDYPRVDLNLIESIVDCRCEDDKERINGKNSILKNEKYSNLNVVFLVLENIR